MIRRRHACYVSICCWDVCSWISSTSELHWTKLQKSQQHLDVVLTPHYREIKRGCTIVKYLWPKRYDPDVFTLSHNVIAQHGNLNPWQFLSCESWIEPFQKVTTSRCSRTGSWSKADLDHNWVAIKSRDWYWKSISDNMREEVTTK